MKKLLFFLLLVFSCLINPSEVFAKDYSIESVDINVTINFDGSADIVENRTYNFDGSYSWADEWINLESPCETCEKFKISKVALKEGGVFYKGDTSGNPGTAQLSISEDKFYIKWFYSALSEKRTFSLSYKIDNAVINHKDTAEFYWQLIGDEWQKGTKKVTATVTLPEPVVENKIWAFGHGPLNGKVTIVADNRVNFVAENLEPKKFFEVRILFPSGQHFSNSQSGSKTIEEILAEEKRFQLKTTYKQVFTIGLLALVALGTAFRVIYWVIKWYKVGRDENLSEVNLAGTLHEPPSDLSPAYVELILTGMVTGKSIISTILELCRRKILQIDYVKSEKKVLWHWR